jgi:hypothetical protein
MLTQDMFFHKSSPILLVIRNHTFLPCGGITITLTLANIMVNHMTHDLNQNRIWLIVIIHHTKIPREKQLVVMDPCYLV